MVKALFDTNILIDYLNGHSEAKIELERFEDRAISVITWMEVMVGASPETAEATKSFLFAFEHVPIDDRVAERAVRLWQSRRIKLPDAIAWASTQVNDRLLVTRNTRDIPDDEPGVHMLYHLASAE